MSGNLPYTVHYGDQLTECEVRVLLLTAQGHGNAGAGEVLYLSIHTVKSHLKKIFVKLGAQDRAHVVALAFQSGDLWLTWDGQLRAGKRVALPAAV